MKHFVNPTESYGRRYELIPTYIRDCALYVHKQTGWPLEECEEFVRTEIGPGGDHPLVIPDAMVLVRNRHGDREKQFLPFDQYLQGVRDAGEILSPTLAAYVHPDKKESLLAQYIAGNLAKRKKAKHEMFVAKQGGNMTLHAIKNAEQNTLKIKNNSLSGAHSSPYTILWNKSSHSTLTSTCRTATSYGNANNEKFLYGNRHYWAPDVVKANLISILSHTDLPRMEQIMVQYGIQAPSYEQTMTCIHRCTDPYWRSRAQMAIIEGLVQMLSPVERAAFLFTGDIYHLAQVNPDFVRTFLTRMSTKAREPLSTEDAQSWIKQMDGNLQALIWMFFANELKALSSEKDETGLSLDKLTDRVKKGDVDATRIYGLIGATAKAVIETLNSYEVFIRTFWVSDNLPASVFYLPNIIRRGAITSDTDSTIFTVQYWTEWKVGKLDFSEESMNTAATMVYLASELIRHILATVSGNMGAAQKDITRLSMKNEYYFPVFCLTSRAKHYFAYIQAQEGNVYKKLDTEIKGVALRNSNVPPYIMKKAHDLIKALMDTVMRGEKISMTAVLRYVAEIEEGIRKEVESGKYKLLAKTSIKGAASYKDPAVSNYVHYGMWEDVFAPKYGHAPEPPYIAIKVSIDADNPTKLKTWLANMEDRAVAERMEMWLGTNGRKGVSVLLLPEPVLAMSGIPSELIAAIDLRSLIFQTMESFYLILEAMGMYMRNDNITRLVSDNRWLVDNPPDGHVVGKLAIAVGASTADDELAMAEFLQLEAAAMEDIEGYGEMGDPLGEGFGVDDE